MTEQVKITIGLSKTEFNDLAQRGLKDITSVIYMTLQMHILARKMLQSSEGKSA